MKVQTTVTVLLVVIAVLSFTACGGSVSTATPEPADLEEGFQNPADAYKPHTFWHWMNGHVSRESITRDLEAMKRVGLSGFTLWNTSEGIPPGPIKYASPEWWALFDHTIREAERLGLKMAVFNGAGWSATGAPFVTPDMAMQEVAWTEAEVSGPGKVRINLKVPRAALGIERDMRKDPEVNKRYYVSRDRVEGYFRDIAVFAVPSLPEGQKPWHIQDWRTKAGFGKMSKRFRPDHRSAPSEQVIGLDQIIDISGFMDAEGHLVWDAPAGNWTILRIGYQPTGRQNHPAAYGGAGLEIDKMSSAAVDFYWENFLDRLVETAGDRAGKTLCAITIDSYEAGHQNWTHDFHQAFAERMGYDFRKFLPVVTGRIVGSVGFTERILWDYRKVIGDLIAENYYGRMAARAAEAGVQFATEPYGSYGNTSDFEVAGTADIPMCEWWAYDGNPGRPAEAKLAASAAHTYGRRVVDAEAFTGRPDHIFESYPGGIKSQGDFFMTQGVNRFSFHTWAHDPYGVPPGLGLGSYGSRFDSRNTWWPFISPWLRYLARCQFMLQQGEFVGDVLYYVGEDAPLRSEGFQRKQILPTLPEGYDYAFCNREILRQLKLADGRLATKNGAAFRVLVLPDSPWMSIEALETIERLLSGGAVVSGPKPVSPPGRISEEDTEKFVSLVTRIWGKCDGESVTSNQHGRGTIYWGEPLGRILKNHGVEPDFTFTVTNEKDFGSTLYPGSGIAFIHRRLSNDDVYFLSNQHAAEKAVTARFRVAGKKPEVWFPDTGKTFRLPDVRNSGGCTEVTLHFDPKEAYFVVFRGSGQRSASDTVPWVRERNEVMDLSKGWSVEFPVEGAPATVEMSSLVSWPELDREPLKYHSGTATYRKTVMIPGGLFSDEGEYFLDLGDVEVIAKVSVNGRSCGIAWKTPYRVDVSEAIKPGENSIEVTVANLWVNRILGDQRYPDDLEWTDNTGSTARGQGLKSIPDWVIENSERPSSNRKAFYAWKWPHLTVEKKLLPSGLLGPVKLVRQGGDSN